MGNVFATINQNNIPNILIGPSRYKYVSNTKNRNIIAISIITPKLLSPTPIETSDINNIRQNIIKPFSTYNFTQRAIFVIKNLLVTEI